MRIHPKRWLLALCLASVCAGLTTAPAGEGDQAQPYEKIRYPSFANNRLESLLEADQAEAFDLTENTPRINLKNVVITLYENTDATRAETPADAPLPVRMVITSKTGYFERRSPDMGGPIEEIAHLEGDVVLRQMRLKPPPPETRSRLRPRRLDPAVETEIHCQSAQWNNTLRKLNGDGEVEFIQEDSRITGNDFLYLAGEEAMEGGSGAANIREWGGIVFIERNARMEIDRRYGDDRERTVITCQNTASYKLREREIQFEGDVKVRRADLLIESDILKVFLRQEDEPVPTVTRCGREESRDAGQVRSIVATIGKRPGSVVITGFEIDNTGRENIQYVASGGRADYDFDSNRITLSDSRQERTPRVEFGQDRISDRNLEFIMEPDCQAEAEGKSGQSTLRTLTASGGQGQVSLRPRQESPAGQTPLDVTYKGDMNYVRSEGRIRFTESVFLKQGDMRIRAELLDVRMQIDDKGQATDRLQRVVAENDVHITIAGRDSATGREIPNQREAKASRAEYEIDIPTSIDTLRLFGPPQRTPPNPWIRDANGSEITAPEIHMQRLSRIGGGKDRHLIHGTGGVSVCTFVTAPDNLADKSKTITIQCDRAMEYDESRQIAQFEVGVVATSDAPEDNYVLRSDRLVINLQEETHPTTPGETTVRLRRIHALGNSRLLQDERTCAANEIIRDFPTPNLNEGEIYLAGVPAQNGMPPLMAEYSEQTSAGRGAMFVAPLIMASADGSLIRANGPGQLSMPDPDLPRERSEIHFEGAARYESFHGGLASEAKFRKGVLLRQPSRGFTLSSEELDARFLNVDGPTPENMARIERLGQLRRAEARVAVKVQHMVRQGHRNAVGDKAVIEFTETGNVIGLSADRSQDSRRFVMARDHDGLTLRAPDIEVREAQGVTRSSGPGELQIPGDAGGEGMAKVPTRVIYGERGQMIYNELALNIKVSDNVRIVQPGAGNNWSFPSLDGRCDRMEITLLEAPGESMSGNDALSRVLRMDALGAVLLRVYADPPPENPNIDWLNRPGTTFFTRGDQGAYYVPEGRIEISGLPGRQPQLLLNMVDIGRPPRRQRLKADRFILNTNAMPRRWTFAGQLESTNLRDEEPFEFQN